jgi:hypothetical protein
MTRWCYLLLLWVLPVSAFAALPEYFTRALAAMSTDSPRGWAYTLTTTRDGATAVERFDPSRPKGGEWTLLARNGTPPDAAEIERYTRYKAANSPPTRTTFERGDIDLTSVVLANEDNERAEFQALFREEVSAPLLPHLALVLIVNKREARVEKFILHLRHPFSSGLGMRMQQLQSSTEFYPPTDSRPALPRESVSRFRGRLFFLIPVSEELQIVFSDYERVEPRWRG